MCQIIRTRMCQIIISKATPRASPLSIRRRSATVLLGSAVSTTEVNPECVSIACISWFSLAAGIWVGSGPLRPSEMHVGIPEPGKDHTAITCKSPHSGWNANGAAQSNNLSGVDDDGSMRLDCCLWRDVHSRVRNGDVLSLSGTTSGNSIKQA